MQHRVPGGIHAVAFQGRHPDPNLADPVVRPVARRVEHSAVVEHTDGKDRARVVHLPHVLLVPTRVEAVGHGPRSHPLLAVLGDAVGVGGTRGRLFAALDRQAAGPQDSQLQHSHRRLPQLLRRRPEVAAHVRRLVHHVVPALQAQPEVQPAVVAAARPPSAAAPRERRRLLQVEPPRRHRLSLVQPLLCRRHRHHRVPQHHRLLGGPVLHLHDHLVVTERLGRHEHEVLHPRDGRRAAADRGGPPGTQGLDPQLDLDAHVVGPRRRREAQVLRFDDGGPQVPHLGRLVDFGSGVGVAHVRGVRVPGLRKRLVRLGPNPDRHHDIPCHRRIVPAALEPVPLGGQGAVRLVADRHVRQVEAHAAQKSFSRPAAPHRDLQPRVRLALAQREHLAPLRAPGAAVSPRQGTAGVRPRLDLHVRALARAEAPSLHDTDKEVLHRLH
ncbi:hypothetical protein MUK42_09884 [Musa troglodytarum]|uniref:Uncharacterized protein n=1 Tax=Musa troglodytarum TaxID=320322 RepID=A0A9E7EGL6_9LILI|nr:hypothetical protein MUK42_09884 [Musa troglodytarum]